MDEGAPERRKSDSAANRDGSVRVLAVDDDRAYLSYLNLVLKRAGFDVVLANSGAAALEILKNDPSVGLVLMDLAMPQMDGIETVQRIHSDHDRTPVFTILLTAHDGVDVKLHALDSGLDDFINKTASESEIIAKMRSAVRRIELERRLHLECEQLEALALTDELTGIANRRALFRAGDAILEAGRRMSVVLFDLDRFKEINDTYGHLTGDCILADVASCLKANTRVGDLIARYGGDEFVLLLPDTEEEEARVLAGRIRAAVAGLTWTSGENTLGVSASFGVAGVSDDAQTLPRLLAKCDVALYGHKQRPGRPRMTPGMMLP